MSECSRRTFIKIAGGTMASGGLILLSPPAEAILPGVVLRFIFGVGVRTTARRDASRALGDAARRSAGGAARKPYRSAVSLGLTASVAFSVSSNVFAQAKEYDAKAIWVNSGVKNNFSLAMQNKSYERKEWKLNNSYT